MPIRATVIACLFPFTCMMLPGCDLSQSRDMQLNAAEVRAFQIDAEPNSLPATATNVRVFEKSFTDKLQLVRFDAPVSEARAFGKAFVGADLSSADVPNIGPFGSNLPWWITSIPHNAEGGEDRRASGRIRQIVMVQRGDVARIWFVVFS